MEWWIWLIVALAIVLAGASLIVPPQARHRSRGAIAQGRRPPEGGGQKP